MDKYSVDPKSFSNILMGKFKNEEQLFIYISSGDFTDNVTLMELNRKNSYFLVKRIFNREKVSFQVYNNVNRTKRSIKVGSIFNFEDIEFYEIYYYNLFEDGIRRKEVFYHIGNFISFNDGSIVKTICKVDKNEYNTTDYKTNSIFKYYNYNDILVSVEYHTNGVKYLCEEYDEKKNVKIYICCCSGTMIELIVKPNQEVKRTFINKGEDNKLVFTQI
jgi:hypothetical protein